MRWSLGWETDLMMRRMSGAIISEGPGYVAVRTPTNPDYRRGNFLLLEHQPDMRLLAGWVAVFQREIGTGYVVLGADQNDSSQSGDSLRSAGFEDERSVVLALDRDRIPSSDPTVAGFDIRQLDGDSDWKGALELRHAVHPIADKTFTQRRVDELRRLCAEGLGVWFGAFRHRRMYSGLGIFSDGHALGRFQHVQTHPDYRQRGLARALLIRAARHAVTVMDVSTLVIVADPEYFAADLYRSVGFVDVGFQQIWQRPA